MVCISNYGNGVMTIDNIVISNKNTGAICYSLFEVIPEDIKLSYYSIDTQGRDIAVNGHIILIEIKNFDKLQYNKIREILCQYKITVNYHCIYKNTFCETKDLDVLFGKTYRNQNN